MKIFFDQLLSKRPLLILIACFYGCASHQQHGVDKEVSLSLSGKYVMDYRAQGNEPFWILEVDNDTAVFNPLYGDLIAATIIRETEIPGGYKYAAVAGDDAIVIEITDQVCLDSMTGMPYPDTVKVTIDGKKLNGCGGTPRSLLQGTRWKVGTLDGNRIIIKDSRITLEFSETRVTGYSSCNRYMADYDLSGELLVISKPVSTRKACHVDIMEQEKRFFRMLQNVTGFGVESDDRIKLITRDHGDIMLQKKQ